MQEGWGLEPSLFRLVLETGRLAIDVGLYSTAVEGKRMRSELKMEFVGTAAVS